MVAPAANMVGPLENLVETSVEYETRPTECLENIPVGLWVRTAPWGLAVREGMIAQ